MGFFDFLKDKKQQYDDIRARVDGITDLTLEAMRPGFLVDYDLKSWQVQAANVYTWGDDKTLEWQLVAADDTVYLECMVDDEAEWSLSRPVRFRELGDAVRRTIVETGDGPDEFEWQGRTYYLEETAAGFFHADGQGKTLGGGVPLLQWGYETESGDAYFTIEQWGETEFQAYAGGPVEEYQFTNILPPA